MVYEVHALTCVKLIRMLHPCLLKYVSYFNGYATKKCNVRLSSKYRQLKTCRNRKRVENLWHRGGRVGQLAVLLIDALRADFVLDRDALRDAGVDYGGPGYAERPKIAFLEAAIAEKRAEARAVVAKATPPTVTLPRIKVVIECRVDS